MPAALERSGKGGYIWIFFDRALPAITARKLGCVILTRTMERRHQLGLDSYDRFFPNQDTMPEGGLGNHCPPFEHKVTPHHTEFLIASELSEVTIQDVYAALVDNASRSEMIAQ